MNNYDLDGVNKALAISVPIIACGVAAVNNNEGHPLYRRYVAPLIDFLKEDDAINDLCVGFAFNVGFCAFRNVGLLGKLTDPIFELVTVTCSVLGIYATRSLLDMRN